jgi:ATP-dependent exoDNAse (exonuclease V) alpha subunit
MITDDHRTRRALNQRARAHLRSIGELDGPVLRAAGQEFQVGDEVIARAPARDLHPPGEPTRHVRNGTRGRVTAVAERQAGMWVDFEDRGLIFVPRATLEHEHRSGVRGIVTHSYALTSHAAQGATFATARLLVGTSTSPAGLYVGVSRGRDDVGVYTATDTTPNPEDAPHGPVLRDVESGLQMLARESRNRRDERLAIEQDPTLLTRLADNPAVAAAAPESAVSPQTTVSAHDLAR